MNSGHETTRVESLGDIDYYNASIGLIESEEKDKRFHVGRFRYCCQKSDDNFVMSKGKFECWRFFQCQWPRFSGSKYVGVQVDGWWILPLLDGISLISGSGKWREQPPLFLSVYLSRYNLVSAIFESRDSSVFGIFQAIDFKDYDPIGEFEFRF